MNILAKTAIVAAAFAVAPAAHAATLVIDVAGAVSSGEEGDAGNTVLTYNLGAGTRITDISYSVNVSAFSPSWLSELTALFGPTSGSFLILTPGFADDDPGTASYTGSANLVDLGLDFVLDADGILRVEFAESFDDSLVSPDGLWNSGTITLTHNGVGAVVPEPATWALMILGMGAVGGAMRYRRRATSVRFA